MAPVYYPITYIPLPWRYLAYLSPTTYAAQIVHDLVGFLDVPTDLLKIDWAVLLSISVFFLWVCMKKSKRREK